MLHEHSVEVCTLEENLLLVATIIGAPACRRTGATSLAPLHPETRLCGVVRLDITQAWVAAVNSRLRSEA